jgi:uncharacterized protein YjbI with pentapeptide repeats
MATIAMFRGLVIGPWQDYIAAATMDIGEGMTTCLGVETGGCGMSEHQDHHSTVVHADHRDRPKSWRALRKTIPYRWLEPIIFVDWLMQWAVYAMSHVSLLELLEYCGSFSILVAVIFYFMDGPERTKLKHYQAWQVINTAQGKGGSGGRTDALHELNEDHVPLVGVDVSDAFLQQLDLKNADLRRSDFHGADLRNAQLSGTSFDQSDLVFANLRQADLAGVKLTDANCTDADFTGASLTGVVLQDARFDRADLRDTDLAGIQQWDHVASIKLANIHGVRNAPDGFMDWALKHGAVDTVSDQAWADQIAAMKDRSATRP